MSNLGSTLGDPFQNGEGLDDDSSNDGSLDSFDDQDIGNRSDGEELVHNTPSKQVG